MLKKFALLPLLFVANCVDTDDTSSEMFVGQNKPTDVGVLNLAPYHDMELPITTHIGKTEVSWWTYSSIRLVVDSPNDLRVTHFLNVELCSGEIIDRGIQLDVSSIGPVYNSISVYNANVKKVWSETYTYYHGKSWMAMSGPEVVGTCP